VIIESALVRSISPRSWAATTAHRYTPMFAADVYVPRTVPGPRLSSGRCVFGSTSAA
jgi:hypothetical protein